MTAVLLGAATEWAAALGSLLGLWSATTGGTTAARRRLHGPWLLPGATMATDSGSPAPPDAPCPAPGYATADVRLGIRGIITAVAAGGSLAPVPGEGIVDAGVWVCGWVGEWVGGWSFGRPSSGYRSGRYIPRGRRVASVARAKEEQMRVPGREEASDQPRVARTGPPAHARCVRWLGRTFGFNFVLENVYRYKKKLTLRKTVRLLCPAGLQQRRSQHACRTRIGRTRDMRIKMYCTTPSLKQGMCLAVTARTDLREDLLV